MNEHNTVQETAIVAKKSMCSISLVLVLALVGIASAACMVLKADTAAGANFAANTSHTCTIINDDADGEFADERNHST